MSDQSRPLSLPSSSARPKISLNISPAGPSSETVSRSLSSSLGSTSPRAQPYGLRTTPLSDAFSPSTSSLQTDKYKTPPSTPGPRSPSATTSHASGILPPTSFFRVGGQGRNKQRVGSSIPYAPSRTGHLQRSPIKNIPASRISETAGHTQSAPLTPTYDSLDSPENIPMAEIPVSPSMLDMEAEVDEVHDLHISSLGHSVGSRTIASRDPLLRQSAPSSDEENLASTSRRAGQSRSIRTSLDRLFARGSLDSGRKNSTDIERGPLGSEAESDTDASEGRRSKGRSALPFHAEQTPNAAGLEDSYLPDAVATGNDSEPGHSTETTHASTYLSKLRLSSSSAALEKHARGKAQRSPDLRVIDAKTGKPVRNYELHKGKNTFFFGGRILTGGDSPLPFIATSILMLGLAGTWYARVAPWWWSNVSPAVPAVAAYLTLVSLSSFMMTAFRDPGILPRDLDIDPPLTTVDDGVVPLPRDLRVRSGAVRVKYCPTCRMYRPPRASHCRLCDNCVDASDHHCQWVNNCVGRRNYTHFFTFLVFVTVTDIYFIVTAALHLYFLTKRNNIDFRDSLAAAPASAVVFAVGIVSLGPISALLIYHIRLVVLNITTIEQVRSQDRKTLLPTESKLPNPFNMGSWRRNAYYMLCKPSGYDWIEANEYALKDRRAVNPGSQRAWRAEKQNVA